jgi:hypothetical protein
MIPQIDDYVGAGTLRKIGGLRTYGQRMTFYLGMLNTATLMIVLYHQSPTIRQTFPSTLWWLAFVAIVIIPAVVAFDYVVAHPSQITYNAHQSGQENRSPNYRETVKTKREVRRVHDRLDEMGAPRVPTDGGEEQ